MRYVIIGNSAAGIGAVEAIRKIDKKGGITVISSEPYHTYSRPLISYYLCGKTTMEKMRYRGASFYEDNQVQFMPGKTAVKIDPHEKKVHLCDGSCVSYDKLLVATGSSPFVPQFDGLASVQDAYPFMGLKDAEAIHLALDIPKRVLIIGAGLIGLKCAEGIYGRAAHITVVDLAPRILSSILDEEGARMVRHHLEGRGIEFKLACGVERFEHHTAVFSSGETMEFDLLILAVGVRPNTALLKDIAAIDKGIIIDHKAQTSMPGIYAAGDCAQALDASSGQSKIMALLPNAYMQGECAGTNMAGGEKIFDSAIPMNAISFFGLHIMTAGNDTGSEYLQTGEGRYKRLFFSDNRLNGYILIGDVEKAGIYTSLVRERTPLDEIDFELICERPGLMAFTKGERAVRLGEAQ